MECRGQSIGFGPEVEKKFDELVLDDAYGTSSSKDFNKAKVDVETAAGIILENELLEHKGKRSHDGNLPLS
jgi:hypothetical protein